MAQGTDGNLYGTTLYGGAYGDLGTLFSIPPAGLFSTLHSFDGTGGVDPYCGLLQATDGNFYGTALAGGVISCPGGCGTVFSRSMGLGPFVTTLPVGAKAGATIRILGADLTGASAVTFNGVAATYTVN